MEHTNKMTEPIKDAGVAQFGNFINYYSFNSAEERLNLLPKHVWSQVSADDQSDTFIVLDIGCNAGNFTQLLLGFIGHNLKPKKNVHILGIDLDDGLIARAMEHNQFPDNVTYSCLNIMDCTEQSFAGHLNLFGKSKFDAVFCLSLTMWIHLNHGDDGLMHFLRKVTKLSKLLVIEPQPWKCYATAVKRMKKADFGFEKFGQLKLRKTIESDIESFLLRQCSRQRIFVTVPTKWDRRIAFYTEKMLDYSVKLF